MNLTNAEMGFRVSFFLERPARSVFGWKWLYLHRWGCTCRWHAGDLALKLDTYMWPS